jgi:glycosyltransferase involved in cell wall biosynthesis
MRIAHVIGVGRLIGGAERYVLDLALAQRARGDRPMIVAPEAGDLTATCEEYGISVAIESRLPMKPTNDPLADPEIGRTIEDLCSVFTRFGVEIIHCHKRYVGAKAVAAGNRLGIPCVFTSHEPDLGLRPNGSFALKFAMLTVCRSSFEQLKTLGFPEEKLYYVPHGTKAMTRVMNGSPAEPPPRPSLISVGRLEPEKGFDNAILGIAVLKRRLGPDCPVLNIYGEGSMEGRLKEIASALGLDDRVRFHGGQPGILERCPATDILVIPSRAETGPMVALEAMSRGMPIVATRVGDVEEMLPDQRYGYIVQAESILALADGIELMLSDVHAGRFDSDLPAARHRDLFTVERMAERIDAVYAVEKLKA